jgi:hypothetical protein
MEDTERGKGQPRKFDSGLELVSKLKEYVTYCEDKGRLPNIAGFAVYCNMNVDTFYAQKEYYSDAYKVCQAILEDGVINGKANDTMKIFYMKNKFNYKDKIENLNDETDYESYLKTVADKDEY